MVDNLELLVAARRCVLDLGQRGRASLTHFGEQVDDLVDPFRREQRPMRAAVSLLPTALAA
jgi:hypothetical protein